MSEGWGDKAIVRASRSVRTSRPRSLHLLERDRVEEQRIGRQRLAAVLWSKAEENDAAFADANFNQRGFAFDPIAAE